MWAKESRSPPPRGRPDADQKDQRPRSAPLRGYGGKPAHDECRLGENEPSIFKLSTILWKEKRRKRRTSAARNPRRRPPLAERQAQPVARQNLRALGAVAELADPSRPARELTENLIAQKRFRQSQPRTYGVVVSLKLKDHSYSSKGLNVKNEGVKTKA